jgi:hypothetical protein
MLPTKAFYHLSHATSPFLFICCFFDSMGWLFFMLGLAWTAGTHHRAQPLIEMQSCELFCLGWP